MSEQLTIDKLDYRNLSFSGRDQELETLRGIFESASASEEEEDHDHRRRKQLVWIHGESGTGKTSLVRHVIMEEKKRQRIKNAKKRAASAAASSETHHRGGGGGGGGGGDGPLFVFGKFDDRSMDSRHNDVPYSGISLCCGIICSKILSLASSSDPEQQRRFKDVRKNMEESVGALGMDTLMTVVPAIAEIVQTDITTSTMQRQEDEHREQRERQEPTSAESSLNRLHFAFTSWIKVVIKFFSPLILVLDDLQWVDDASLTLLEALMRERNLVGLVLVGIYRSNQVDGKHPLTGVKDALAVLSAENEQNLGIVEIPIGNLNVDAIHCIIRDLLTLDDDPKRTMGLAELCSKKTSGNAFFLIQYMEMLHRSQLLQFNLGSLKWMWDEQAIVLQTEATDNVVSLLQSKMESVSADQRQLLPLAASLGTTFSERVIGSVWNQLRERNDQNDESIHDLAASASTSLSEALASFEADGYIERLGDGTYRWAHDRIREAAASLVPEERRDFFNRQLGETMLATLDEEEIDSLIFDIIALLNQSAEPSDATKRLTQARLNLKATRKAIASSAFALAARTASEGIELLNGDGNTDRDRKWQDYYDLCLELYSLGAQAEGYLGNVLTMESYCDEVLAQKNKPVQDKFRVYDVLVDSLANRAQLNDAVDIILGVLSACGCNLPARGSMSVLPKTLWNVIKIKRKLNRHWFDDLEPMNDALRVELV
ncbi:MAG: hypothetical protein SGARI_000395, partial [Bacillariaceae sp.]